MMFVTRSFLMAWLVAQSTLLLAFDTPIFTFMPPGAMPFANAAPVNNRVAPVLDPPLLQFPQPTPSPPYLDRPFTLVTQPDPFIQNVFHQQLRDTFRFPAAHVAPAHRDPITLAQLEEEIRNSGNTKRFIQLGYGPNRQGMRLAFALPNVGQGVGQKYFALLSMNQGVRDGGPTQSFNGFVKASGVYGMEEVVPHPVGL